MAGTLGIRTVINEQMAVYVVRRGSFSSLLPVDGYTLRRFDVAGIFSLDLESEQRYALLSLRAAQELFDHPGQASALAIGVTDGGDVPRIRREVARLAGDDFEVRTRDQMNATFFDWSPSRSGGSSSSRCWCWCWRRSRWWERS